MATLNPLTVFTSNPQSQHYIKTTQDEPGSTTTTIETTFDLTLKIPKTADGAASWESVEAFPSTEQSPPPSPPSEGNPEAQPRHYRIFPDYETDFITRSTSDLQPGEDRDLTAEEALGSLPVSVREQYRAWVDAYNREYKKRVEDTGDDEATVFGTVEEEVAWNVAGYLLVWRITFAPEIGSVQYGAGRSRYFVPGERQVPSTVVFLNAQTGLLESGKPSI